MRFLLEVKMDNAAFDEEPQWELARILRGVADDVTDRGRFDMALYDINGNAVGRARMLEA